MKPVQEEVDAEDVADQDIVDWKQVPLDVHYNHEAHIFFAEEELEIVESGIRDI